MTSVIDSELPRFTCSIMPAERPIATLAEDARQGLLKAPRSLPPKYFYDAHGSELFDRICDTPEYYVMRVEAALLERHAADIVGRAKPLNLVELGSGAARKTGHLLRACERHGTCYWPFDVCESMLRRSAAEMTSEFPWLSVHVLLGDYTAGFSGLPLFEGPTLYVFLGSSIGNYSTDQAITLLGELRRRMAPHDRFLLGADRIKDPAVLDAAYNDALGLTAAFNLNLLSVLNDELGANFDPDLFEHRACYVQERRQIEMHLVSGHEQRVWLRKLETEMKLAAGELILTEISRKYSVEDLGHLIERAGLKLEAHYEPADQAYSLLLCSPDSGRQS